MIGLDFVRGANLRKEVPVKGIAVVISGGSVAIDVKN